MRPNELNDFFALNHVPFTLKAGFASKLALTVSLKLIQMHFSRSSAKKLYLLSLLVSNDRLILLCLSSA